MPDTNPAPEDRIIGDPVDEAQTAAYKINVVMTLSADAERRRDDGEDDAAAENDGAYGLQCAYNLAKTIRDELRASIAKWEAERKAGGAR
jgi:hypothetical protein